MNEKVRDQAESLRELVSRQPKNMKVISVASGKGGVGKSSISVNLAIALSKLGQRVLVVDADFGLANVDVMLGVNSKYNISHFLRGERDISDIIQEGHMGVRFISGGSGIFELLQMDESQLRGIMTKLMELRNPADIILFDSGAGISDNILQLILASSESIIVTTPEPTAILDAYALIKTIVRRDGSHPIRLIMNKSDSKREAETAISGFQKVITRHLSTEVESLGYVLYDSEVPKSIKQMTPIMITNPDGSAARDITAIAKRFLNLPSQPVQTGLLARIFSRWL